jgi:hypothetical protein
MRSWIAEAGLAGRDEGDPQRLWLVVDDVHELGHEALRQLELLIMRARPQLRIVLATRHDVRLGLHRLRLEGELAEIRAGTCGSVRPRRETCSRRRGRADRAGGGRAA